MAAAAATLGKPLQPRPNSNSVERADLLPPIPDFAFLQAWRARPAGIRAKPPTPDRLGGFRI